jgi:hypothetical protein
VSQYAGIVNPKKALREVVASTATQASGAEIYVTIPWPVFSTVERIIVASTQNFSNMVVEFLTDAAAYRAASSGAKPSYVTGKITQAGSATNWYDFASTYQAEDARRAGYLYLRISLSTGSFTTGSVLTVTAEGYARLPVSINDMDRAPWKNDPYFRVMRLLTGATSAEDLTAETGYNLQPLQIGQGPACLAATTDTLYIGSDRAFSALEFGIYSGAQPAGSAFTFSYWNGSTWATFTPLDNTSDGQATASRFSYSGTIGLPTLTSWTPVQITEDPYKIIIDEIIAGTRQPMGMSNNPDRYWIKIVPTTITGTLKFNVVRTLN